MSDMVLDGLEVKVDFVGDAAVVTVSGDLAVLKAAVLAGVLDALVDGGRRVLVVDCAGVTFIDAAGVGILERVALHLRDVTGSLTLRSTSKQVRQVLDGSGVGDLVVYEQTDRRVGGGDSAEQRRDPDVAVWSSKVMPRSSTATVDAALRLVTTLAESTLEHADGVSVTLERYGRVMTVAASDDAVKEMDGHQYDTGEGPCLAAKSEGRFFYIESLAEETRWPKFVPLALEQGIHSILSSPLMTNERPQGALNIYSSTERAFGTRQQELAALFAEQASTILTTAEPPATEEELNQRVARALAARQVIHQAQGVIMERDRLTAEIAVGVLHRAARAAGVTVADYATQLVDSVGRDGKP